MDLHRDLVDAMRALHENRVERALAGFPAPTPVEIERERITWLFDASVRFFEYPLDTPVKLRLTALQTVRNKSREER